MYTSFLVGYFLSRGDLFLDPPFSQNLYLSHGVTHCFHASLERIVQYKFLWVAVAMWDDDFPDFAKCHGGEFLDIATIGIVFEPDRVIPFVCSPVSLGVPHQFVTELGEVGEDAGVSAPQLAPRH